MKNSSIIVLMAFLYTFFYCVNFHSCTGITMQAKDGSVVFGRTLEFAHQLDSDMIVVPHGYAYKGETPSGDDSGFPWKVKYGFVAMNFGPKPFLAVDGVNEKGLAVGSFYLPGYTKYQPYEKKLEKKTISEMQFPTWLLSNFATVKEVKENLNTVRVVGVIFKAWSFIPPLHFIATDQMGESVVIEFVGGNVKVHENKIGVITNAPEFDWHMTNLRNYINLSPVDVPAATLRNNVKLKKLGVGSGMVGLPGDFTSPSRFVRAAAFSSAAEVGNTGYETVRQVFHVLNQFDIPVGVVREPNKNGESYGQTQWTSASDTKARRFYVHTINNCRIRMVDLKKANLDAKKIAIIPIASVDGTVEDFTPSV